MPVHPRSTLQRLLAAAALALSAAFAPAGATPAPPPAAADWIEDGRATPKAVQALAVLADAARDGLDPRDYAADGLARAVRRLGTSGAPDDAALGAALTRAMRRFLTDLHRGRLDPRTIHADYGGDRRDPFDAGAALRAALDRGHLDDAVRAARPAVPLYERLRGALARYRALSADRAWDRPRAALPAGAKGRAPRVEPGDKWSGVEMLARRLAALGDLASATPVPPRYEGALADAVRAFQRRHGLADDGVIGRATWAALQVRPSQRVRQIELTMERLRWTPLMQAPRMIVVNLPEFVLRAYEVRDGRLTLQREMKVVVGKALDTRTPQFDEDLRSIEFSPYWNVPPSIARAELVPRLRRDPAYWVREGFEFVEADGRVETVLAGERLDAVLAGRARIRQRPGPRNALGDIKFVFPNRDNIYLHHTPAVQLFDRDRRDFSHGCIRVEHPVALATFVLQEQPGWDEARIREAMDKGESNSVRLDRPIPVLIAYATALVLDGRVHFYEDLYGHDRLLDTALRQRSRESPWP